MGMEGYERWYLFFNGRDCCDKYFPLSSNCPYEDSPQTGYYWEIYHPARPNDASKSFFEYCLRLVISTSTYSWPIIFNFLIYLSKLIYLCSTTTHFTQILHLEDVLMEPTILPGWSKQMITSTCIYSMKLKTAVTFGSVLHQVVYLI